MYLDHELGDDAVGRAALAPDALLRGPNVYGVEAFDVCFWGLQCIVQGPGM